MFAITISDKIISIIFCHNRAALKEGIVSSLNTFSRQMDQTSHGWFVTLTFVIFHCVSQAFVDLTQDIFELVGRGDIQIQEGWEGVKSGFVPNTVHSSEEVTKGDRRCLC